MSCSFSLPFTGEPQQVLSKARSAVEGGGGVFNGNDQSGNFQVTAMGNTVAGTYAVAGQELQIVITSKPFFVPCRTIENFLKSQLA